MTGTGKNLANHTRQVWQSRTRRELTENDCREIERNVFGFWRILADWAHSNRDGATANVSPLANTQTTIQQKKNADDSKTQSPETQVEPSRRVTTQAESDDRRRRGSGTP